MMDGLLGEGACAFEWVHHEWVVGVGLAAAAETSGAMHTAQAGLGSVMQGAVNMFSSEE